MNARFEARYFETGRPRERLKLFEDAAAELQAAEFRQDVHPFDLSILLILIDIRATAGDRAVHNGGEESYVGLSKRIHRQQMVTLRRIQACQIPIKPLDKLARGR